ncbi:zinc-ribbon domain-containing protein [Cryptosporangium japonicum]|uniref:Zinc-ribbon 15 domain-containing protein n=1 Tax=Cryptosporangium japonicum TaxID=80872 RepID=A0ABN0UEG8_9ACTN
MFLIFGFRTKVYPLGWIASVCHVCGQGRLALLREVTKFSLFFVPLFPVRTKYVAECGNPMCRTRHPASKRDAQLITR